jgi:inner membrane protein involved in colicin E2 resistance
MIWFTGLYSEAIHFGCAFVLAWAVLRLIRGISLISLPKDKSVGILLMVLVFGCGGLLHLWLDTWQLFF